MANSQAPVALFAFNRPKALRDTVEALRRNSGATETPLYVFCDGAKDGELTPAIEEVRSFLDDLEWEGGKHLDISDVNRGLASSIRRGVSRVVEEYDRVIVLEDDILTRPEFLDFMNRSLDRYAEDERVFTINGMGLPTGLAKFPQDFDDALYFSYRPTSHGWSTWRSRWVLARWEEDEIRGLLRNAAVQKRFDRMGSDCCRMLESSMNRKVDSWAIKWAFTIAVENGLCLTPVQSYTSHQPTENGTHVRGSHELIEHELSGGLEWKGFPEGITLHREIAESYAACYGPTKDIDFSDTMKLANLTERDMGGGIKLLDIGASGALNSKWATIAPLLHLTGFDPNEEECLRLSEKKDSGFASARYLPYAVAGESGSVPIYQTESIYCWSLLEPDKQWLGRFSFSDLFEVKNTEEIDVKTLNDVSELKSTEFDAAKLDVQGMEYPILSNAEGLMDSIFYLETETGFTANYKGETKFAQISDFLQGLGFVMFDINPNHRVTRKGPFEKSGETRGQPLWCEAVWLRDLVDPINENFLESLTREKCLRILLLCAVEEFYDYGWEVAGIFRERGLITDREFEGLSEIEAWILPETEEPKPVKAKSGQPLWRRAASKVKRTLTS